MFVFEASTYLLMIQCPWYFQSYALYLRHAGPKNGPFYNEPKFGWADTEPESYYTVLFITDLTPECLMGREKGRRPHSPQTIHMPASIVASQERSGEMRH